MSGISFIVSNILNLNKIIMTKQEQIDTLLNKQGFPALDLTLFLPELEAVIFNGARDASEALDNYRALRAKVQVRFNDIINDMYESRRDK